MFKKKALTVAALASLAASLVMIPALQAQQTGANLSTKAPTLTAMDFIEIQQLVARYAYAVDSHADNGHAYADLFAPDGTFGNTKGREQLAALARNTQKERGGPAYTRHFLTNVIITPTPQGVTGRQYLVAIDVAEGGKPSTVAHGGHYDDVYVKTPEGWRFKSRTYVQSKIGPKPGEASPAR